jgi:putative ABC transport system permease protein
VYDFEFVAGRPYTQAEFDGGRRVAVVNRTTAARLFGSGPALGRTFAFDDQPFEVVGVVDDVSFFRFEPFGDIWIPYSTQPPTAYRDQFFGSFNAAALAEDAAGLEKLHDEFNSRMMRAEVPAGYTTVVAPFETRFDRFARNGPFRNPEDPEPQGWKLQVTLAVIALLFTVIPIVNLVNLNVSRIMERSSEIGVRKAFGAPALTLVGQFVVENVLLTLIGGGVGLLLSAGVVRAINASGTIPYSQFTVNLRVFGIAILMSIVFGILSGVYPAWRMSRLHPVDALKGAAR